MSVVRMLLLSMATTMMCTAVALPCSQAGCDPQRTFRSENTVPLNGNAARTIWQNNGLLSTPLSIDSQNRLYSATSGDVPSACQVNASNGQVHWCTKLPPAAAGGVQLAQAAVVEWAQVSVWLSSIGVLYALRQTDGAVVWNITLGDAGAKGAAVPAAPLSLDPFKFNSMYLVSGIVAAHGSSLQRVLLANGTVAWSVDLCHFIQGPLGANSSPCYVATAGASLLNIGSRAVPVPVVLVPVADAKFGPALIVVDAHNGTLVTHIPLAHQQQQQHARARTAPLSTVAAPPLGIAGANLSVVPAPELGLTAMFGVNVSAAARPRVLWESELLPQRFGVTLREKDVVWACNFSLCGASFVSGHQTFKSESMRCPGDEGPFDCVAQSPVLRTGQMMLVGAGLLGAPQGALIALDDRGRILWTYTGSRGHRPLVNVLTPVVGSDGTIYVNDAAGSMHAIRVTNQSMPTSSPAPQSSTSLQFTTTTINGTVSWRAAAGGGGGECNGIVWLCDTVGNVFTVEPNGAPEKRRLRAHLRDNITIESRMSRTEALEEQVLAAEQLASDTEAKLARLLAAVKADREARPPLGADEVVDERYVQRMEEDADIAEAQITKLHQQLRTQ